MKAYQENRKRYIEDLGKPTFITKALLLAICLFALATIAFSLWNTTTMEKASKENAEDYVNELTVQIAGTVSTDQSDIKSTLTGISDALELLLDDGVEETGSQGYLQSYLEAISNSEQYDYLAYFGQDGLTAQIGEVPESIQDDFSADMAVAKEAQSKRECVAYIENDEILYAAPVYRRGELFGTVIAGSSSDDLKELIDVQTYRDESNFCLTNRKGKLLLESGDGRFTELKNVLESGTNEADKLARDLEWAIIQGKTGVFEVNLDGSPYLLSYAPIEGEDWMMLTLLPVNLFSGIYSAYMDRAFAGTVGAAFVFVALLASLVVVYRSSRKNLEKLAFSDELTGGINNAEFHLRYETLQRRANPCEYSIVMLDIRDFKLINESAGFAMGDEVLRHVCSAIDTALSDKQFEMVARIEADHFIVCLHENTEATVQQRINDITTWVNKNSPVADQGFHIEFKQGACIVTSTETSIATLQERARLARKYMNRSELDRCTFYNDKLHEALYQSRMLDRMAEDSLANRDFVVYYQPKVSMSTGRVKGAEALIRWRHPEHGLISPATFVPVLEESGRIQALDRYVFEEVCRWQTQRKAAGKEIFPVSVNLSRANFWNDDFLSAYVTIADKYEADRSSIEFEITETVFMDESKLAKIKDGIRQMHAYGFRCAVDDFGVGYSSLSLVHEMEVDTLKFDRSFFTDLQAEKSQKVAHCLINMATELDLGMVIEGIETQEQIDYLKNEQCDIVQGFYYSRPLPEEEFNTWVDNFEAAGNSNEG